jgi:hypothetical protein
MSAGRSVLVVLLAVPLWCCSNAAVSKAVGTTRDGVTAVVVRPSESSVIVENHAGRPLLAVRVTITATDAAAPFVMVVPTLEPEATSELALTSFRSEEGVAFDPASVHPREVQVHARDTLAKSYDVTVPWKP